MGKQPIADLIGGLCVILTCAGFLGSFLVLCLILLGVRG